MKKKVLLHNFRLSSLLGICLVAAILVTVHPLSAWAERQQLSEAVRHLQGAVIAIDAGHGGVDPGAIGVTGSLEKEVNLSLAKKVQSLLKEAGATVVMTREDDSCYSKIKREDLDARAKIVEDAKADIFLSLQCNALREAKWQGCQVFYYPGSVLGEKLAALVQQGLKDSLNNSTREALSHNEIYILRALSMPAIVVEAGFLSNPEEEALLLDDGYQDKVAAGILNGLAAYYQYLAQLDSNV